jgi:cytochrome oxidase assembly protein ShyY1
VSSIREHPAEVAPGRRPHRLAFLARPGWIGIILVAFAFAGACFFILAPWQFDRNDERVTQNAAIDAALTAPSVPVTDLLSVTAPPSPDISWRVVTATGEFDESRQVFVRLRQDAAGQPVSEVVVPFRLDSGESLLVDRGYVSFAEVRAGTPLAALPTGTVTITGRIQGEQTDPANRPIQVVDGRTEVYAINRASVGGDSPEPFLQGYVQLTGDSPGVLGAIEVPQTDSGPFLSYALQWSAFGVIALLGIGVFLFREITDPRPPDERDSPDTSAADAGPAPDVNPVTAPAAGRDRRRSRDGFDRSQLYDS